MLWKNKIREKGWIVKNDRPEEYLGDPRLYYTTEEVEKYSHSGGMRRAQEKIAYRVLELLELKPKSHLLDLGSGPGYSAEIYRVENYRVTCIDLIPEMIEKAREKEFEAQIGDMRNINEAIGTRKFDGVVSVSALQWIKNPEELRLVANGIYSALNAEGRGVIQFYPKSEKELNDVAHIFKENGFNVKILIDCPDIPKNRTIYLIMEKK